MTASDTIPAPAPDPAQSVVVVDAAPPEPPPPPAPAPEPVVIEADPQPPIEDAAPSTDVAVPEPTAVDVEPAWTHESEWSYDWLEFKGDKLAIRIPKGAALQALSSARHNSLEFQDRVVHLFVSKHMSDETYERITYRMVDPDDEDFTTGSWGELINAIAELGTERVKAEAEALAAVSKGDSKASK